MVFQSYALYPHLDGKINVLSYFLFRKKSPELDGLKKAKYERTSELMGVELAYLLDRKPTTLSGGEQQRVALGRCITRDASLFLVDEPFANLDQALREKYRANLKILLRQFDVTTVYVTHDHHEALLLAHRLAVMNDGTIEQVGTPEAIYDTPVNMFVAEFLNLHLGGWICFLLLSIAQLIIVRNGMEAVRHFQGLAGPIIWVVMLLLMFYFLGKAGWTFDWFSGPGGVKHDSSTQIRNILVTAAQTVGTLATLMLNFSDFARYSPDKKSIFVGCAWGLPINWTLFAVTSVITTAAAAQVLHADMNQIKDPGILLENVDSSIMFYAFTTAFVFATIGVNIVANFVSAAFDISNVNPGRISFRTGGLITAIASIVVTPWNYFNNPIIVGYFLGSLGALLGPFFGILVVDYYLIRRQKFSIRDMYLPTPESIYYYNKGVSRYALFALIPSAIVSLSVALLPTFSAIRDFGWFIGAPLAGIIYFVLANNRVIVLPAGQVPARA